MSHLTDESGISKC